MKAILTTALAVSLLSGTAAMAQPEMQFRVSQNDQRDRQDNNRQDRRDRKAADKKAADQTSVDKKAADLKAAQRKAAEKTAKDRRTRDRSPADRKVNTQRANDQKTRGERAVRQRANDKAVNERRVNDQRKADRKAIEQRTRDRNQAEQNRRDNATRRSDARRWSRGQRLPDQYRQDRYYVKNWRQHGLRQPPRGYRWVRDDNNDFFLAAIATGIIATVIYRDDREQRWNRRYSRTYSYQDDVYYRECRNGPDPAGVIAGAIIGGLLGNTASGGRTGATVAGVVAGGAIGAALTRNLDCEDQSYAYKTYYDGFNSGRANSRYDWRNPRNGHRGELRVGRYYNDPSGFRCTNFIQDSYVQGRSHKVSGKACRQPDGTWAIVN